MSRMHGEKPIFQVIPDLTKLTTETITIQLLNFPLKTFFSNSSGGLKVGSVFLEFNT